MSPLLAVSNLTVSLPASGGYADVVRSSSFTIGEDDTLGIVGESGSGKSMTALAIMGLLPRGGRATGSVKFDGTEILGMADRDLRHLRGAVMSMIFQDPLSSLNPYYTVGLQIEEAYLAHRGGSRKAAHKLAAEAMAEVGIPDPAVRARHYPHQFSGGQRQRIMIAMALICEPKLLIADEPTTALDVTVQAQVLKLLARLQAQTGMGLLFITHDLAVISQVARRVVVMRDGEQLEYVTTEEAFCSPRHAYTRSLLEAIPRIDDALTEAP
ncbi:MAG TPA: ABC transporter ATP-binding protein [Streptosporangiaceae bacterium]|nr:ABC transporter ATP-binding protein [Streptosporangiaceae bacterium]